jgi:hypothetical protein
MSWLGKLLNDELIVLGLLSGNVGFIIDGVLLLINFATNVPLTATS